jgi:predicted dehydrogenase
MPQTQSQLQTCDVDAATVEIAANVGNGLISQQPGQQQPVLRSDLSWRVRPEIAGGGYFVDYAPHQLDILDFLLGPIEEVQSLVVNQAGLYPAEDIVCAQFCFASGVLGSGVWCFTVGEGCTEDYMEIVGSKGYIRCEAFGNMGVRWQTVGGSGEFVQPRPRHIQQDMLQKVVDELLGRGKCPSDGHSAIRTNRVLDQILCSYYKDREKLP